MNNNNAFSSTGSNSNILQNNSNEDDLNKLENYVLELDEYGNNTYNGEETGLIIHDERCETVRNSPRN